ncbi:DUF4823 domain-containing protein [Citrobacter sp. CK184]|uniref:DUF4823 domain-containing protein n=1 Tax=Citrobacter TaxID=544 RepID=UPI0019052C86|nr:MULTISPECIES: DUF4823 domain-containing protein [Citrobacter]MBJ9139224.1 DUF4823 domain-containing protein [Citrobacter koseri]MDM2947260.1 DUF4823 domain-containing protein [Citrobacter sp. CK207]MDM2957329.1 DUF4823 domain-containing protein [Citrobacter sp. CK206]MDM3030158.1 DUF4823 domain-containing protein [Citrobacter sp. CK185]MDM3048774.1 DUF4823 domain-containing protein [Citrobacter sp. CK184]
MKRFLLVSAVILLAGCSAKYNTNNIQSNTEQLVKDAPVAISMPSDGVYETRTYAGSGNSTATALKAAFLRHSDNVAIYADCEDVTCLKNNHTIHHGYYVVPQILHWEDRATEWSGIPDKIEVKITIYNAESNNRIASTIISGKSKWATFGGDHPQDLLPEPVNSYISSLY